MSSQSINSCWDVSVGTKVTDWPTLWSADPHCSFNMAATYKINFRQKQICLGGQPRCSQCSFGHVYGCGFVAEPQDGVQPWFITKPKPVSAVVGQHVLLSCAIAGDPFPQYTWTRADLSRPLTSGGDYELLQKEDVISLLIRSTIDTYIRRFQTFLNL